MPGKPVRVELYMAVVHRPASNRLKGGEPSYRIFGPWTIERRRHEDVGRATIDGDRSQGYC
jgi:hypothetical protein